MSLTGSRARVRRVQLLGIVLLIGGCLAACGGTHHLAGRSAITGSRTRLIDSHPCPGIGGFTCSWLVVPLDHAGQAAGTLKLAVGMQQIARPPHGVLLFLTGGPGQPGVSLIAHVRSRLGSALDGYRLVMFDQRGTGAFALRCPALQAAAGASDLAVVPPSVIVSCAHEIGPARRYFSTPETVADIEALRSAIGSRKLTLDGVSYGSYVAERYALTYPNRVARLVLDSVVPQQGVDPLYLAAIESTARVLRTACKAQGCHWDPASDLRVVLDAHDDGPQLLNALVAESVAVPSFVEVLGPLHQAAEGHPAALDRFLAAIPTYESAPADELSQGLHESTLCLDLAAPWNPDAGEKQRALTLQHAVSQLTPREVFPFDPATAYRNGLAQGCLNWPATQPPAIYDGDPAANLPHVPVLLLAGERDLSTPLAWAQEETAKASGGRLIIVPDAGHSVQTRSHNPAMRAILRQFLAAKD